jgi:hypothetical protein
MIRTMVPFAAFLLLAGILVANSQAVVLHEQPLADWAHGLCSPCTGDLDSFDYRGFGSFALTDFSRIERGTFAVYDNSPFADDVHISIWNAPFDTELYSLAVSGGSYATIPYVGSELYYAEIELPDWTLPAGDYWISYFGTNGNLLGWGSDGQLGDDAQYLEDGSIYINSYYYGFLLSGSIVPEPACIGLLATSSGGVLLRRRTRRR